MKRWLNCLRSIHIFFISEVITWVAPNMRSNNVFRARTELQVRISTGNVKLQVYKHISAVCTSKNKSASLTSLCQDLDYTCKLIPKSKPASKKILVKNSISRIFRNVTWFLVFLICPFPWRLKTDTSWYQMSKGEPARRHRATRGHMGPF